MPHITNDAMASAPEDGDHRHRHLGPPRRIHPRGYADRALEPQFTAFPF